MSAYYNERDPSAAEWLRNLVRAGLVADGEVDQRPIAEVSPRDLHGFTQCHFFAGVGVWSHALRRAGWSDDRPVWTGSCPCQPFSAAGKQKGFDDERHLWPVWFDLIKECRPPVVLGEQVASALDWLDLVSADLEGADYAFGASDLCAAGFGGAHIRQRLYFVGADERVDHSAGPRRVGAQLEPEGDTRLEARLRLSGPGSGLGGLCDPGLTRLEGHAGDGDGAFGRTQPVGSTAKAGCFGGMADATPELDDRGGVAGPRGRPEHSIGCADGRVADTDGRDPGAERQQRGGQQRQQPQDGGVGGPRSHAPLLGRNPADWLLCRDGKWRPVEPGTFPLADAAPARVGRLRAYGNALDAETATQFCGAVMDTLDA